MSKEGLTEIILVFWVAVSFSWCGFDDQLHGLDHVLSPDEAPCHRTTVPGTLWQFHVILEGEGKQQGQYENMYMLAKAKGRLAAPRR